MIENLRRAESELGAIMSDCHGFGRAEDSHRSDRKRSAGDAMEAVPQRIRGGGRAGSTLDFSEPRGCPTKTSISPIPVTEDWWKSVRKVMC